jgi:RsiW-degrading membrane proteinase PrsW (M82 family)
MDFGVLGLALAAAVIPTVVYVTILVLLDCHEREPWSLIVMVFIWGAAPSIMLALMVEPVLMMKPHELVPGQQASYNLFNVAVMAPAVEEVAKALALLIVFWFARKEFDGIMDGLLYGSLAGFGFAMTENALYLQRAFAASFDDGLHLTFMRVVLFGLNHALFTSMFGLGLGIARYGTSIVTRALAPVVGLGGAVALHMFHNFAVSSPQMSVAFSFVVMWLGVGMWLLLVYAALQQEAKWIREELAEEVAGGLLTAYEAEATANFQMRPVLQLAALRRHDDYANLLVKLYDLAAELAFKKRQFRVHGKEEDNEEEIQRLRDEIRALRATAKETRAT